MQDFEAVGLNFYPALRRLVSREDAGDSTRFKQAFKTQCIVYGSDLQKNSNPDEWYFHEGYLFRYKIKPMYLGAVKYMKDTGYEGSSEVFRRYPFILSGKDYVYTAAWIPQFSSLF